MKKKSTGPSTTLIGPYPELLRYVLSDGPKTQLSKAVRLPSSAKWRFLETFFGEILRTALSKRREGS